MACERAGRFFKGCNWQVMYDEQKPSEALEMFIRCTFNLPKHLAELGVIKKEYAGAVCRTCGKHISREEKVNGN